MIYLLLQKVTSSRFTILNGCRPAQVADYTAVLERRPRDMLALCRRGLLYKELEQYQPALQDLEQAGLDEGILPLSPSNLLYMENPYSYKKFQ
jgi:regulator of sirC expression with transglutaminase-like and TPR domain